MHPIGNIIRNFRKAKGWTQDDLADAAGIHRVTIAKYESGEVEPKSSTLKRLAAALEVDSRVLLGEIDEMTEEDQDLWTLRETVRRDPERRILFNLARNADISQVRQAVAIIDALKKASGGDSDENP